MNHHIPIITQHIAMQPCHPAGLFVPVAFSVKNAFYLTLLNSSFPSRSLSANYKGVILLLVKPASAQNSSLNTRLLTENCKLSTVYRQLSTLNCKLSAANSKFAPVMAKETNSKLQDIISHC